ncbi:MAG: hypothetical protein ACRDC6_20505 [Shewanella sp.]
MARKYNGYISVRCTCPQCGTGSDATMDKIVKLIKNGKIKCKCEHCENEYKVNWILNKKAKPH